MKYITGGYVGEEEAGTRLFQVIHDPKCFLTKNRRAALWIRVDVPCMREARSHEPL